MQTLWMKSPCWGRGAALRHSGGATPSTSALSRSSSPSSPLPSQVYLKFCFSTTFPWSTKVKCGYGVDFADVLMLMASGLETEPQSNVSTQEDDTLTPSNKSQADSLAGSTSGLERSESGLSLASKLRRSSSSGHFNARSPVLSPQSEVQTVLADSLVLDQDSWDNRVSETETGTSGSGQSNAFTQTKLVSSSQKWVKQRQTLVISFCMYVFYTRHVRLKDLGKISTFLIFQI